MDEIDEKSIAYTRMIQSAVSEAIKLYNFPMSKGLEELKDEMKDGFKGVHARQDKINKKVLDSKEWIDINKQNVADIPTIKKDISEINRTITKYVSVVVGAGVVIQLVINYFMKRY